MTVALTDPFTPASAASSDVLAPVPDFPHNGVAARSARAAASARGASTVLRPRFGESSSVRKSAPGVGDGSVTTIDRHDRVRRILARFVDCDDQVERRRLAGQIVMEHQGVVRAVASRYRGRGVDRDDLVQLANLGLLKAVQRWQPGLSDDFLQFAVPTMTGEIKRYFRDHSSIVRPPRRIQELRAALATEDGSGHLGVGASDQEVAERQGVSLELVREARQSTDICHPRSLDAPTVTGQQLADNLGFTEAGLESVENRLTVSALLAELTEREQTVLRLRFVDGLTQARIGELTGVSQMQISRLLRGITDKLRRQLVS